MLSSKDISILQPQVVCCASESQSAGICRRQAGELSLLELDFHYISQPLLILMLPCRLLHHRSGDWLPEHHRHLYVCLLFHNPGLGLPVLGLLEVSGDLEKFAELSQSTCASDLVRMPWWSLCLLLGIASYSTSILGLQGFCLIQKGGTVISLDVPQICCAVFRPHANPDTFA